MRKQTDLAKVKQTALALLSTEINETPYSPMIVKHPFTDTGVSAIPDGKGGVEMIDLTEDDAQLRWRQSMARQIDKADNAYAIYMMVTKPYALTFLKFAMPHLSREDMSQILASAWTRSEAPHQDVNITVNQLLRMFKQADPTCLMEQDEYIQFKALDDTVTVYRGVTTHNAKSVKALSWSLSQETAEWFAHRFGEDGTVYEAQIDKKHIYAYFSGRNESEVIVDPSYLTNITEVQDLSSDFLLTSDSDQAEFLVAGVPGSYADLEGWTAFESFMNEVDTEQDIKVHVAACLYGEGEVFTATPEEVAYFTIRAAQTDDFF